MFCSGSSVHPPAVDGGGAGESGAVSDAQGSGHCDEGSFM